MKKVGYFFLCFVPLIASVSLQFIVAIPVMGFCIMQICFFALRSGRQMTFTELLRRFSISFSGQNYVMMISILFAVCGILLFGFCQAIPWKPAYPGGKLLQASISSWNYLPCPRITASLLRPDEFLRLLISTMDGLLCGTDG